MKSLFFLLVLLIGIAVGWYVMQTDSLRLAIIDRLPILNQITSQKSGATHSPTPKPGVNTFTISESRTTQTESTVPTTTYQGYEVSLSNNGFEPNELTVPVGTTVRFINKSNSPMQVMSDMHPDHTLLPEFVMKRSVGKEQTFEFTFSSVGTWAYHLENDINTTGLIIVSDSMTTK